ncbi:MAG: YdcF family protein [Bacteroidota bacterium]|nr:YdcF family protein [Bacteroidota bacterium]MDP4241862.1 YdcF family protein [Bacteroidota bacterium]MDP4288950.1 YdcF family protein [Bacteroidota bacterium]
MLGLVLLEQIRAYIVLTQARYSGQGLATEYFRLNTTSDLLSLGFAILIVALTCWGMLFPRRIGEGRTLTLALFSTVMLWLDYGVRRSEASDFSPEAAVALLLSMCLLLAVLLTHSRPQLSVWAKSFRILRNTGVILLLFVLFAFGYAFVFPTYSGTQEIIGFNADAGVVLGAAVWRGHGLGDRPSPALQERLDVGYDLLVRRAVPRLVLTGASAPGELAEAEVARQDLLKRGIDASQIIMETTSHTTLEQVRYMREELQGKQNWSRFVLISDQYHLARVSEMCRFNRLSTIACPSRIRQSFLDLLYYRLRESVALMEYWLLGR